MMLKLSIVLALMCCHMTRATSTPSDEKKRPNVIIMHVDNLHWSDLGIHVNKADNENSTPNIDRLAYAGIILNRFYGNGGKESLHSGCYQRSTYCNTNLLTTYFERNGYNVNSMAVNDFHHIESFERQVLALISTTGNQPFFLTIDFGHVGVDMKIPFIDDLVGAIVMKAHEAGIIDNTIISFISLPSDSKSSPIESNIRRSAFIYSPLLSLQQRVSNQLFHVSDILPTLVNATSLKWPSKDRYFVDGINQWMALNTNVDVRSSIYGDNFYISNNWKLSHGMTSNDIYDTSSNQRDMEGDKSKYDYKTYMKSIASSEIHVILEEIPTREIMLMRNRARVHCNMNDDVESEPLVPIKCSQVSPCLFDLLNDPCELDDKDEAAYESQRKELTSKLEHYLNFGEINKDFATQVDSNIHNHPAADGTDPNNIDPILTPSGGWGAFTTLGLTIFTFIFTFVIIVCFKERCNTQRSVYGEKSNIVFKDESGKTKEEFGVNSSGRISTVSSQIEIRTHL